ncbi:MAG: hypothetical protein SVR94_15015, partial [Pseudomonadota bacterium]|nr:hypothetical protein [Pseudomonadota bacterium]
KSFITSLISRVGWSELLANANNLGLRQFVARILFSGLSHLKVGMDRVDSYNFGTEQLQLI